ncbi:MAG: PKD domain-containing protein [Bacteroidota bacterium]
MKPYIFLALFFCFTSAIFAGDLKTLVLQPGPQNGFDAYINSVYPDQVGWNKGLLVTAWTLGGVSYVGKSLLRFDLSQLGSDDSIISAKLSLFFDPEGSWPEQYGLNEGHIRRITGNWDYMTVTWNTQPDVSESDKIDLPQSTLPQQNYTDIDVTGFAQLWKKDAYENHGMMVSLDTQTPYACLVFAPSDRDIPAVRPRLVITYTSCKPPVAGFFYNLDFPVYTFHDTSVSYSPLSWHWDFGDGKTSTLKNPRHIYIKQGNYKVCLQVSDNCSSDAACTKIVFILPTRDFKMEQNTVNDLEVRFTDMTNGATGWQWSFGDGDSSSVRNPVHSYKQYGDYLVCMKAKLPGKDSTSCGSLNLTSLDPGSCSVTMFPNPPTDKVIYLLFACDEAYADISVSDIFGHRVYLRQFSNIISNNKIDLSFPTLPSGLYFLKVDYPAGSSLLKMVIP